MQVRSSPWKDGTETKGDWLSGLRVTSRIMSATFCIHLQHVYDFVFLFFFIACLNWKPPFWVVVVQQRHWLVGWRDSHAVTWPAPAPAPVQLCEQLGRAGYQQTDRECGRCDSRGNYTTNNVLVTITPWIINNPSSTADFETSSSNVHNT